MFAKKALSAAPAAVPVYIEDVFSTYLYTGTGSAQTITNNIDISGEGGMLWIKDRTDSGTYPVIVDTARGSNKWLSTSDTFGQQTSSASVTSFTSSGFTLGADNGGSDTNSINYNYGSTKCCSWSFRKTEKFFDVVTYTGNDSSNRQIAHNLKSVPGCIIVKCTSGGGNWAVYHRSHGNTKALYLNSSGTGATASTFWNNTDPTSTHFTVGSGSAVNTNGETYVAYLFAHDEAVFGEDSDQSVIKCGGYTANGSSELIDLGWEPQWLLIREVSGAANWHIFDNMRGVLTSGNDLYLYANSTASEGTGTNYISFDASGFRTDGSDNAFRQSGVSYVYVAIRRGPMKTPESGTEVYSAAVRQDGNTQITTNFPVDLTLERWYYWSDSQTPQSGSFWVYDRQRGISRLLKTNTTDAELTPANGPEYYVSGFDSNTTVRLAAAFTQAYYGAFWNFKRAPGFFDQVCYTGSGSSKTVKHNLGVAPELIFVKGRNAAVDGSDWAVYAAPLGATKRLLLNSTAGESAVSGYWSDTAPTSTVFTVGNRLETNDSTGLYVAYLFGSVTGVSKVGSYTGTGSTLQINCGFSSGARFVLVKRTDTNGDWYLWDTTRGIVSGDDPYLRLNSVSAQTVNTDWIDTYSPGFELSNASGNNANINGATYIYLAIA